MIETEFDVDRCLVLHRASGVFLALDIMAGMTRLRVEPRFKSHFGIVWDLRACAIELSIQEVDDLVSSLANGMRTAGRTAFVTASEADTALVTAAYASQTWNATWKTFAELDPAIQWATRPAQTA